MKKYFIVLLLLTLFWGTTCQQPRTCPLNPNDYILHHLTEKGFHHIFEIDTADNNCTGCHHVSAEKCGIVTIERIKKGKNGVFSGRVTKKTYPQCTKRDISTFFPETWSVQTTLDKIEEAYQNSHTETKFFNKRQTRQGKTYEGILIKIIMDENNPDKIYNAYPILEEGRKVKPHLHNYEYYDYKED